MGRYAQYSERLKYRYEHATSREWVINIECRTQVCTKEDICSQRSRNHGVGRMDAEHKFRLSYHHAGLNAMSPNANAPPVPRDAAKRFAEGEGEENVKAA